MSNPRLGRGMKPTCMRVFHGLAVFSLAWANAQDAHSQEKRSNCPEKEFVEFCLKSMTSFSTGADWARARGWSWQNIGAPTNVLKSAARATSQGSEFVVDEVRFPDTILLSCHSISYTAVCENSFTAIRQSIPPEAVVLANERSKTFRNNPDAREVWHYEHENWRIRIEASISNLGKNSSYRVSKILAFRQD